MTQAEAMTELGRRLVLTKTWWWGKSGYVKPDWCLAFIIIPEQGIELKAALEPEYTCFIFDHEEHGRPSILDFYNDYNESAVRMFGDLLIRLGTSGKVIAYQRRFDLESYKNRPSNPRRTI